MLMNKARNSWAERLFLITTNPDEIPVRRLQACRKRSTKTGTGAHAYATVVQRGSVRYPGELELASPNVGGRVVDQSSCEIALDTADQVVVLRMRPL